MSDAFNMTNCEAEVKWKFGKDSCRGDASFMPVKRGGI